MDDKIICPNCGEANPPDLPFCQHCQWRLHGLDDDWDSGDKGEESPSSRSASEESVPAEPVPDWLSRLQNIPESSPATSGQRQEPDRATANKGDLLAGLAAQRESEEEQVPDWVARIMGLNATTDAVQEQQSGEQQDSQRAAPDEQPQPSGSPEPSWLQELGRMDDASTTSERGAPPFRDDAEVPITDGNGAIFEWLRHLDDSAAAPEVPSPPPAPSIAQGIPSWVDQMMGVQDTSSAAPTGPEDTVPEWVLGSSRRAESDDQRKDTRSESPLGDVEVTGVAETADVHDLPPAPTPAAQSEPPADVAASRRESDDVERLDVDALFASMQMPEWLGEMDRGQVGARDEPPVAASSEEEIRPATLPTWVEAMKPQEPTEPPAAPAQVEVLSEERGPLLGLRGVLPALPGAGHPSSKPKSQSLKLDVSEQHRAHAALLEELLDAETAPLPLKGIPRLGPERLLRWGIGALLVGLLSASFLLRSTMFALPTAVPIESNDAIQAIESLEPDAAVLAVFDYEPAVVGEMQATAASLMDHLLLLKHPRMTLISTSPVGSALAEGFVSVVLADRAYVRGQQYVNLGYLPGGLAGVRSFAEAPAAAVPLGAAAEPIWNSAMLTGIRRLSDFSAIIVLTESVEGGRIWIEQTQAARASTPLIVIASAQAGPMLLPYYDSGQIAGLVSGLNGAAGPEIANGGLPGLVREYWDAYSLGMYGAAAFIIFGAASRYWVGRRDRNREFA